MLRVHRIPFSTNVERVALAAAHKGLEIEWVDHDPADRSALRALSGQDLVPVLEHDGRVIVDSTVILAHFEANWPEPALYPQDPARRAEVEVFVDWFNRVWKAPPNAIEAELGKPEPDLDRIVAWAAELRGSLALFEALLDGREYLMGDVLTAADVAAFPFVKYGVICDPDDDELFHQILIEHLALGDDHPRVAAWIRRMDALPRA